MDLLNKKSPAEKVFDIFELSEAILQNDNLGCQDLYHLQHVSSVFRSTIWSSPILRSSMFLDNTPQFHLPGPGALPNPYCDVRWNPIPHPKSLDDTNWTSVRGCPRFQVNFAYPYGPLYGYESRDTMVAVRVLFASKAEACALLRPEILHDTWQKMYVMVPALPAILDVTYPCVSTLRKKKVIFKSGGLVPQRRLWKWLTSRSVTIKVEPSTLGRMMRLAAKTVAQDDLAWDGELKPNLLNQQMYEELFEGLREGCLEYFERMVLGTKDDAVRGLAVDSPDGEDVVQISVHDEPTEIAEIEPRATYSDEAVEAIAVWYMTAGEVPPWQWKLSEDAGLVNHCRLPF